MCLQILAILAACFLCHQRHILLKRKACVVQTFDGHLFDASPRMPDVKRLVGHIDKEHHLVACQLLLDVVRLVVDRHAAMGLDLSGKGLPVEPF
jgi:hypothetical protein